MEAPPTMAKINYGTALDSLFTRRPMKAPEPRRLRTMDEHLMPATTPGVVPETRHKTELEIAKRLFRVGTRVERWNVNRMRSNDDLEFSLAQRTCLYYILQGVDTSGELAKVLLVTPTAVTALVDRLVKRGFVERTHDTADRRRVILSATDAGADDNGVVGILVHPTPSRSAQ